VKLKGHKRRSINREGQKRYSERRTSMDGEEWALVSKNGS
jgi:hypothetical protein